MRLLNQEGVESIAAAGRPYDPVWHEAMGSIPGGRQVEPGTVIEVVQRGYRLGDRLLRPARAIVAA
jgi:molecular chaperone GrpE